MEDYMKLVPLGDRVVIKALIAEETTKSGIVLPGQAKEKPQQAEVVAVGPGGLVDGKEVKMQVKPGDKIIYSKYSGTEVKLDEDDLIIVKQSDILAVIE
jgi:chaperonin GroES